MAHSDDLQGHKSIQTIFGNKSFDQGYVIEGSLETKIPTIRTDEKDSQEVSEPGRNSDAEKVRREKIRDGESQKREDARKGRKVVESRETLCFSSVLWLRGVEK